MSKGTEAALLVAVISGIIAHAIGLGIEGTLLTSVLFMAIVRMIVLLEEM
jgi:hypothetical protein